MEADYRSQVVVVDTDTPVTYIGSLAALDGDFCRLHNVVLHDARTARISVDQYLCECAEHGTPPSRREVLVRSSRIVSLSKLCDVVIPGKHPSDATLA